MSVQMYSFSDIIRTARVRRRTIMLAVSATTHFADVAGLDCRPLRAALYSAPAHHALYSEFLGCPFYFGAAACELHYDAAIFDCPTKLAHKFTSSLMQATCVRLIGPPRRVLASRGRSTNPHGESRQPSQNGSSGCHDASLRADFAP